MNEIIRWKPFLATYTSYDGRWKVNVRFRCPRCGGSGCDRKTKLSYNRVDDRHFWQGGFRCSNCGEESDKDGGPFYYASECFVTEKEEIVVQLTLFD